MLLWISMVLTTDGNLYKIQYINKMGDVHNNNTLQPYRP